MVIDWKQISLFALLGWALWGLSLAGFYIPTLAIIIFALLVIGFFVLTWQNLAYGLVMIFAELLIGVYGYLFAWQGLSLRLSFFIIFLVISTWRMWQNRQQWWAQVKEERRLYSSWLAIVAVVVLALINGVMRNSFGGAFLDSNAYGFLLLCPAILFIKNRGEWPYKFLTSVLLASVVFWFFSSLDLLIVFSRGLGGEYLSEIYHWLRGFRLMEITSAGKNFWRIFSQSQVYLIFFVLWWCGSYFQNKFKPLVFWSFLSASFFVLFISFSRSFWLGLGLGLVLLFIITCFDQQKVWSAKFKFWALVAVSLVTSLLLAQLIVGSVSGLAGKRLAIWQSEAALDSRKNQLEPLWQGIKQHVLVGSGFGTQVTYLSHDPRHPGLFTTYAFEWGYLDMILKFGIVGLVVLAWWLSRFWPKSAKALFAWPILLALLVVHVFSPYLNHPLGLGYIYWWAWWSYE